MLFDQATPTQLQSARVLTGATLAAFLAARALRGRARMLRLAIAGVYVATVLAFILYAVL